MAGGQEHRRDPGRAWSLDDWEQYAFVPDLFGSGLIEDPAKALSMWRTDLDEMYAHGCFTLTSHPFLTGRLGRLRALEELVVAMKERDDLWVTTAADVAAHTATLGLTPRVFPRPDIPSPEVP